MIELNRQHVEVKAASLQEQKREAGIVQQTTQSAPEAVTKIDHAAERLINLTDAAVSTIKNLAVSLMHLLP